MKYKINYFKGGSTITPVRYTSVQNDNINDTSQYIFNDYIISNNNRDITNDYIYNIISNNNNRDITNDYIYNIISTPISPSDDVSRVLDFGSKELIPNERIYSIVDSWFEDKEGIEDTYGNISEWEVSKVSDMSNLFSVKRNPKAIIFNEDISNWDLSGLVDANAMFYGAEKFNQNINEWNLHNLKHAFDMFRGATDFKNKGAKIKDFTQHLDTSIVDLGLNLDLLEKEVLSVDKLDNIRKQYRKYYPQILGGEVEFIFNNYTSIDINSFYRNIPINLIGKPDSFIFKTWITRFRNGMPQDLIEADDVGGITKKYLFSTFVNYLFYDPELLESKYTILKSKLQELKADYKTACKSLKPIAETPVGKFEDDQYKYFNKKYNGKLGSACALFDQLHNIVSIESEQFKYIPLEYQNVINKIFKKEDSPMKKALLTQKINEIWWLMVENMFKNEYDDINNDINILNKDREIESLVPFKINNKEGRRSLVMNDKLDKIKINSIFASTENFYEKIAILFYKYLTQDLPIWLPEGGEPQRQFARDYIPFGKLFGLFLSGIETRYVNSLSNKLILDAIYHDNSINEDTINMIYRYKLDGTGIDESITQKDDIYMEWLKVQYLNNINKLDIPTSPSAVIGIKDVITPDAKKYLIMKYICNNNDNNFRLFDIFINKFHSLSRINDGRLDQYELTSNINLNEFLQIFDSDIKQERFNFIELLKLKLNNFQDEEYKINRLNIFIKIVEELDDKQLNKLFKWFAGIDYSPNVISINFIDDSSSFKRGLFKSHLCSNGIDIPLYNFDDPLDDIRIIGYTGLSKDDRNEQIKLKLKTILLNILETDI